MATPAASNRWTRTQHGRVVHVDSDAHAALVMRTLGIDDAAWMSVLDHYTALAGACTNTEERLDALSEAFRRIAPVAAELPRMPFATCAACGQAAVSPVVARRAGAGATLVYGACAACAHGQLLSGASVSPYLGRRYFEQRARDGSGYSDYASERAYREGKGEQLVARLLGGAPTGSLLEVGSGYGFTLQAARAHGLRVAGVDVNPDAVQGAQARYGLATVHGSLQTALDEGSVAAGEWDVVLYQFVLEHIAELGCELAQAARALSPSGRLVLVVPSMTSFELKVFGASYRSLRGDHLHLFSAASIARLLREAGLSLISLESHCNLHLLQGFLDPDALQALYSAGRGPDLTVIARRNQP